MRCRLQRNRHPRIEVINEQQTYKESSSFSSSSASLHPHCGGAPHQEGWRARHHHQGPTSVTTCVARPIDLKKRQQAPFSPGWLPGYFFCSQAILGGGSQAPRSSQAPRASVAPNYRPPGSPQLVAQIPGSLSLKFPAPMSSQLGIKTTAVCT